MDRLGWEVDRHVIVRSLHAYRELRNEVMQFSPDPLEETTLELVRKPTCLVEDCRSRQDLELVAAFNLTVHMRIPWGQNGRVQANHGPADERAVTRHQVDPAGDSGAFIPTNARRAP